MPEHILRAVLQKAVYAPSGDNAQPWEFEIRDAELFVFNKPDADSALYNFHQRGSYVAHGALLENMVLLCAQQGYFATIEPFPKEVNCTARVTFSPITSREEILCEAIPRRATNRKPYVRTPIDPQVHTALLGAVSMYPGVSLRLMEDRDVVEKLSRIVSINDQLFMENKALHAFLFGIIRWSREDERNIPGGLFVDTMELPPPVRFMFKYLLKHWSLVEVLQTLNFSKFIAVQTSRVYASSGAIGILTIPNTEDTSYLIGGRAFERMWLTAVTHNLSVQPITALPYLAQRIEAGEASMFSEIQQQRIKDAYDALKAISGTNASIAMVFRIGKGDDPTARSEKWAPVFRNT